MNNFFFLWFLSLAWCIKFTYVNSIYNFNSKIRWTKPLNWMNLKDKTEFQIAQTFVLIKYAIQWLHYDKLIITFYLLENSSSNFLSNSIDEFNWMVNFSNLSNDLFNWFCLNCGNVNRQTHCMMSLKVIFQFSAFKCASSMLTYLIEHLFATWIPVYYFMLTLYSY